MTGRERRPAPSRPLGALKKAVAEVNKPSPRRAAKQPEGRRALAALREAVAEAEPTGAEVEPAGAEVEPAAAEVELAAAARPGAAVRGRRPADRDGPGLRRGRAEGDADGRPASTDPALDELYEPIPVLERAEGLAADDGFSAGHPSPRTSPRERGRDSGGPLSDLEQGAADAPRRRGAARARRRGPGAEERGGQHAAGGRGHPRAGGPLRRRGRRRRRRGILKLKFVKESPTSVSGIVCGSVYVGCRRRAGLAARRAAPAHRPPSPAAVPPARPVSAAHGGA